MTEVALRTARTVLRPITAADVSAVHELWTTPEVRRFLFDDRVLSLEEARSFLEASDTAFRDHRYGLWLAEETGRLVGFAGLLHSPDAAPNLVFGVHPASCGRGVATEIASEVLRYGFETLRLPEIAADVDEPNAASIRVLEKLGMRLTRQASPEGRPMRFYSLVAGSASDAAPPLNPATSSTATRRDKR